MKADSHRNAVVRICMYISANWKKNWYLFLDNSGIQAGIVKIQSYTYTISNQIFGWCSKKVVFPLLKDTPLSLSDPGDQPDIAALMCAGRGRQLGLLCIQCKFRDADVRQGETFPLTCSNMAAAPAGLGRSALHLEVAHLRNGAWICITARPQPHLLLSACPGNALHLTRDASLPCYPDSCAGRDQLAQLICCGAQSSTARLMKFLTSASPTDMLYTTFATPWASASNLYWSKRRAWISFLVNY